MGEEVATVPKWEYQWWDVSWDDGEEELFVFSINDGHSTDMPSLYEALPVAGADGWELVGTVPSPERRDFQLFFKRELSEAPARAGQA